MEKTIRVVDEDGNRYEATYPKRAKGLVKHGRARFIEEDMICLACPPKTQNISEEITMTNTENKNLNTVIEEKIQKELETQAVYTLEYALAQIEKITNSVISINLNEAFSKMEGASDEQMANMADIVRARETTNQRLLAIYEKMVDDLKPKTETAEKQQFLNWVRDCTAVAKPGAETPNYAMIWETMYKA